MRPSISPSNVRLCSLPCMSIVPSVGIAHRGTIFRTGRTERRLTKTTRNNNKKKKEKKKKGVLQLHVFLCWLVTLILST